MLTMYAKLNNDGLVQISEINTNRVLATFSTVEEFEDFVDDIQATYKRGEYRVYCSSSIDFPEDETSNPVTLEICDRLRG